MIDPNDIRNRDAWTYAQGKLGKSLQPGEVEEDMRFFAATLDCTDEEFRKALQLLLLEREFPLKYANVAKKLEEMRGGAVGREEALARGRAAYQECQEAVRGGCAVAVIGDAVMARAVAVELGTLHAFAEMPRDEQGFRQRRFAEAYADAMLSPGEDGPRVHILGNPSQRPLVAYLGDHAGAEAIALSEGFQRDFPNARLPGSRVAALPQPKPWEREDAPQPAPEPANDGGGINCLDDVLEMMRSMGVGPARRVRPAWLGRQ